MKSKSVKLLYVVLLIVLGSCNKNSNELAPILAPESSIVIPKFVDNALLLEANVFKHKTASTDSFSVSFTNRTSAVLNKLRVVVEICSSLPQQYGNCKIYLDTLISIPQGSTSTKYLLGKNLGLPLSGNNVNVYVISYESQSPNVFSGVYQNRYSLFLKDATLTAYPQLYGFVTADGEATFRIKVSDSMYYTIDKARFQSPDYFTGQLLTGGQILSYLSLDKNAINLQPDSTSFKLLLSTPLEDSTNNIHLNAIRKP